MTTNFEFIGDLNDLGSANLILDKDLLTVTAKELVDAELIGAGYTNMTTAADVLENVQDTTIKIAVPNVTNGSTSYRPSSTDTFTDVSIAVMDAKIDSTSATQYAQEVDNLTEKAKEDLGTIKTGQTNQFAGGVLSKTDSAVSTSQKYSSDITATLAEWDTRYETKDTYLYSEIANVRQNNYSFYMPLGYINERMGWNDGAPPLGIADLFFNFSDVGYDINNVYHTEQFSISSQAGTNAASVERTLSEITKKKFGDFGSMSCSVKLANEDGGVLGMDGLTSITAGYRRSVTKMMGRKTSEESYGYLEATVDWDEGMGVIATVISGIGSIITAPFKLLGSLIKGWSF